MNTPSSSVSKLLSRATLALALTTGASMGTPKEADAAPGDQIVKITNPDAYLCTSTHLNSLFRLRALSIVQDTTQPKGKDVSIASVIESDQQAGLAQDIEGKPITTYRGKYYVISWPGNNKLEGGFYFVDKDTKTIALAVTTSKVPEAVFSDLNIIEGQTPVDDILVLGGITVFGTPSDGKGGLQVPNKIKGPLLDLIDQGGIVYKSTMIGVKADPSTGNDILKRFDITASDIKEKESIDIIFSNFGPFITYKDQQGKETTYITVTYFGTNGDTRLYNIKNLKDFKEVSSDLLACPDGRFEFKAVGNPQKTIITDTWSTDVKTNVYTATTGIPLDKLAVLQGYDIPTFESTDLDGKHWLIQVTSINPLAVTVTEYISTEVDWKNNLKLNCIPNPQPPAPKIETKPAGAETVEGAETSGADTSGAEAEVVEAVVVEKEPDAGSKEVISSSDGNNSDGDATGSPETVEPSDTTKPSDTAQTDANPVDADKLKDIPVEQDVVTPNDGTQPTADAGESTDAIATTKDAADAIGSAADTAQQKPPSSPSPSANSGCSATPGTTRTSTRSALAQLGFLMTIAAGAQMMRRRKETARQE